MVHMVTNVELAGIVVGKYRERKKIWLEYVALKVTVSMR